ncbi:MAG: histidine--tRNA ligase [Elusimicrobia bacterium]|nr:histidine--tRNA ligase [Elusimicrobiota bacterium]
MSKIRSVRGIRDVIYPESGLYAKIERVCAEILESYGYRKIYLPVIEFSELFKRSIGDETDIVSKEMYSFEDRKGRSLSLRPEGTASAVRAMIENKLLQGNIREKIYYLGPMFRYERPQEGRYRQFYQIGCEVFGSSSPASDAEIAVVAAEVLSACQVENFTIKINSVGCQDCRPAYRHKILEALSGKEDKICADCKRRLNTNTLRILDCKNQNCREIYKNLPSLRDYRCDSCEDYYGAYKNLLQDRGIAFKEDNGLVRGLDYYTGPVFELEAEAGTIAAGGRYDSLVSQLGGPETPACGWAFGLERLALSAGIVASPLPEAYIALMPGGKVEYASRAASILRDAGLSVEEDYEDAPPKKKLRQAVRKEAKWAVLVGGDEVAGGYYTLRNFQESRQEQVDPADLVKAIKDKEKAGINNVETNS